jgi:hypothetical protein
MSEERIPVSIQFGNQTLDLPVDITPLESANLSIALTLASQGLIANKDQSVADNLIKDLNIERLFVRHD